MKNAETEGTDLTNSAKNHSIGLQSTAETEGTDSCIRTHKRRTKYISMMLLVTTMLISNIAFSSDLKLFTTDNQTYKGIIQHNNEIYFLEGYIEAGTGYFMLDYSLEGRNKATDEGTGGKPATDEGTGGSTATDEGTGGKPATDEGTGGNPATDEGTGGNPATDEGTGGSTATDEGTGGSTATDEGTGGSTATDEGTGGSTATDEGTGGDDIIETGLVTVNFSCTYNKSPIASIQSINNKENITIERVQINGTQQKCNQDISSDHLQ